jgi:hypothetical protein
VIFVLFSGLAAGVVHCVLGPDHVAALAPFSVEAQRRAWVVGLRWGVGHAVGIVAVAIAFAAAADRVDLRLLGAAGDYVVGGVLVAVGLWGLAHGWRAEHALQRGAGAGHLHHHVHATAALSIGTLHGLVGTGSTLAVLPTLGLHAFAERAAYLSGFAAGTIFSMSGIAWLLGVLAPRDEVGTAYRRVFYFASSATLALGLVWLALALAGVNVQARE